MELVEYRNNVYYVHGRQLANISDVIDTMTLIRYALENEDGVDRGVIKAAVSLAQDALNDVFDQIQEHQEVTGREAAINALRQIRQNPKATPGEKLEAIKLLIKLEGGVYG